MYKRKRDNKMRKNAFLKKVLGLSAIGLVGSSLALTAISCSSSEKQDEWDKGHVAPTKIENIKDYKIPSFMPTFAIYDEAGTTDVTNTFIAETGLSLNKITGVISGDVKSELSDTKTYTMVAKVWYKDDNQMAKEKFEIKPKNSTNSSLKTTNEESIISFKENSVTKTIEYTSGETTSIIPTGTLNDKIVSSDGKTVGYKGEQRDDIDGTLDYIKNPEQYTNNKVKWDIMLTIVSGYSSIAQTVDKMSIELVEFDRKPTGEVKFKVTLKYTMAGAEVIVNAYSISGTDASASNDYTKIVGIKSSWNTKILSYTFEKIKTEVTGKEESTVNELVVTSNFTYLK